MTRDEFVEKYTEIVCRALHCHEKARTEGLLALEGEFYQEKIDARDIFEYGLQFTIDGIEGKIIDKILSNIIKQEKDEDMRTLKTIQKEAVLMIREGYNPRIFYQVLNSYTDITIKEDEIQKRLKWKIEMED
jgi:flagellar motor component MotA